MSHTDLVERAAAWLAMLVYGREYSRQSGGSMDFYDQLPSATKLMLRRWCDELESTPRA